MICNFLWYGVVVCGVVVYGLALRKINIIKKSFLSVVTCNDQYCYYLLKSTVRWNVALAECRRFNADLLSVHDSSEKDWIVGNILQAQAISRVHLGKLHKFHTISNLLEQPVTRSVVRSWLILTPRFKLEQNYQ